MRFKRIGEDTLQCVNEFCYLGDMLSPGGGAESSSICRVRCSWKKFRELLPMLTSKGLSLKLIGKLYDSCVRSVMLYGGETWAIKEDDIRRLEITDLCMIRWMCNVSLTLLSLGGGLFVPAAFSFVDNFLHSNAMGLKFYEFSFY